MKDTEFQHRSSGKSLFRWLCPSWRLMKWPCLLFSIGFIFLQIWAYYWVQGRGSNFALYGADRQEWNRQLRNTKLSDANNCLGNAPVSAEYQKAYKKVADFLSTKPGMTNFLDSLYPPFSDTFTVSEIEEFLTPLNGTDQPALDLSRQTVTDIQSLTRNDLLPIYIGDNSNCRHYAKQYLHIKAYYYSLTDSNEDAFHYYISCLPLLVQCPYQKFIQYQQNRRSIRLIIRESNKVLPASASKDRLSDWLILLNNLEPFLFINFQENFCEYFLVNKLRNAKHKIAPVPGKTGRYYIYQLAKQQRYQMDIGILLVRSFQKIISKEQFNHDDFLGLLRPFDLTGSLDDYFCNITFYIPDFSSEIQYETDAALQFDVLRLKIAAKLYELETGKKVTATADLVPEYFPEEIKERGTGASYQWNPNGELKDFN